MSNGKKEKGKDKIKYQYLDSTYQNSIPDRLFKLGVPFKCEITRSSVKITSRMINAVCTDNDLKFNELGLIRMVKSHCETLPELHGDYTPDSVTYYQFFLKPKNNIYHNVLEIDINSAYWKLALQLGYITPRIYRKGIQMGKAARLVALGSLATQKIQYSFDGAELFFDEVIENKKTRKFWFHISLELGNLMKKVIRELGTDSFYFFWVDAFFCKPESHEKIRQILMKNGFRCKVKQLDSIEVEQTKRYDSLLGTWLNDYNIWVMEHGKDEPKHFPIPSPFTAKRLEKIYDKYRNRFNNIKNKNQ